MKKSSGLRKLTPSKNTDMKTEKISLSANEKIGLISNMSTMLSAGIPILETVDSLLEDAKGNQKKLLETVRADLMQGQHVFYSFAKFPRIFDKVTINIIKASEEAGTLDVTLKDLKDTIKKEMEFGDKIKSALIYPMFIMVIFIATLLMILVVVIPKIATVFLQLHTPLPLPTRVLIFLSTTLLQNTIAVIAGGIIFVVGLILLYKKEKRLLLAVVTGVPVVSALARDIDLTRFCRSLFLLLNAGIPITTALELTEEVVTKKEVRSVITSAKEIVSSGKRLSEALKANKKVIPPIVIKMIEAGEKTGSLDQSMQDASEYLDYQVSGSLKKVTTLIEPLMLVMVGVLVGGMMLAIIAPIYGLISQIGSN